MSRYDNDLRRRVAKRLVIGLSAVCYREVSELFDVYVATLRKWSKKKTAGTLYDEIHIGGRPAVYDLDGLKKFVDGNPDKYICEIKEEFFESKGDVASESGITKALGKMDFRLKKSPNIQRSRLFKKEKSC